MFDEMLDDMTRLFGPGSHFPTIQLPRRGAMAGLPRTDVAEKDHTLIISAELPGVRKEDVYVELQDDALIIRGESRVDEQVRDEDYLRTERSYGSFYRRLPLPFKAKVDQVQASLNNGVLEIRIPEPAESHRPEPTQVPIS
jgi:HSP20 family protein